jgi:hypothetical protein
MFKKYTYFAVDCMSGVIRVYRHFFLVDDSVSSGCRSGPMEYIVRCDRLWTAKHNIYSFSCTDICMGVGTKTIVKCIVEVHSCCSDE